jgi:hypothetical protein
MFAIGLNRFFLASSPDDDCVFISSLDNGVFDTFEVIQGTKVAIKATRKH